MLHRHMKNYNYQCWIVNNKTIENTHFTQFCDTKMNPKTDEGQLVDTHDFSPRVLFQQ